QPTTIWLACTLRAVSGRSTIPCRLTRIPSRKPCPSPKRQSSRFSIQSPPMPHRRFDWHEHIKDIEGEYQDVRFAVNRLRAQVAGDPTLLKRDDGTRAYLNAADGNLEGTYLVRLFAAFEAALRSYDRDRHN